MSERKRGPDWNLLQTEMEAKMLAMRIRAGFALDRAVHGLKYRTEVSSAEHQRASRSAEAFAGEALTFLEGDLMAKLSPLYLTGDQVKIFQNLMDSIGDGSLSLKSTKGRLSGDNRPFVVKHYETGDRFGDYVHLTVRWGVTEPSSHGFAVSGRTGMEEPDVIDFITFPQKPRTIKDVWGVMGISQEDEGGEGLNLNQEGVYGDGRRIDLTSRSIMLRGQKIAITHQYYLVGAFDGQDTARTFWLYGNNSKIHDRMSVSQRAGAKNLAEQRA